MERDNTNLRGDLMCYANAHERHSVQPGGTGALCASMWDVTSCKIWFCKMVLQIIKMKQS